MEAKEYLKQIKVLEAKIKNKKQELKECFDAMQGLKGISYEIKPSSASRSTKSTQERLIHKYLEYERELEKDIQELLSLKRNVVKMIDLIDNDVYINILYKRYIFGQEWDVIAYELGYSTRNVLRMHGKALIAFNDVMLSLNVT